MMDRSSVLCCAVRSFSGSAREKGKRKSSPFGAVFGAALKIRGLPTCVSKPVLSSCDETFRIPYFSKAFSEDKRKSVRGCISVR